MAMRSPAVQPRATSLKYLKLLKEIDMAGGAITTSDAIAAMGNEWAINFAATFGLILRGMPSYGHITLSEKGKALVAEEAAVANTHKACRACQQVKELSDFYATTNGTPKSDCKSCYTGAVKARKKAKAK